MMAIAAKRKAREFKPYLLLIAALFVALFILPSGWWARYVPFFALVPCLVLLFLLKHGILPVIRNVLLVLMSLNLIYTTLSALDNSTAHTLSMHHCIKQFKEAEPVEINFGSNVALRHELQQKGIRFKESKTQEQRLPIKGTPVYVSGKTKIDKSRYADGVYYYYKSCLKQKLQHQ